jgi:hypothetical protein
MRNLMEDAMRWFGPGDTVSLAEIRQTGATAVFSALHEIPYGEAWPTEAIARRRDVIAEAGLAGRWGSTHVHQPVDLSDPCDDLCLGHGWHLDHEPAEVAVLVQRHAVQLAPHVRHVGAAAQLRGSSLAGAAPGAPLLGVDGRCIICHGISNAKAIKNAREMALLPYAGAGR